MENIKTSYKGDIAFEYRGYWSHRRKVLSRDGTIQYRRVDGFKTPEEAEKSYFEHLDKFEIEYKKLYIKKANNEINFKDYLIYWFEDVYSNKVMSTTLMPLSYTLYEYIMPNIQYDIKLRLVTVSYIEEIIDRIQAYSKPIAAKAKETLYLAFKDAVSESLISENLISKVKNYYSRKKEVTILNRAEIKKLLSIASKDNWYLEILLALFCGLRKGEIMALKFSDFDMEEKTVTIERQITYEYELKKGEFGINKRKQIVSEPKTKNGYRTLRVPKVILDELIKRKERIEFHNKNTQGFIDEDFISIQKNGNRSSVNSLYTYLNRTCTKYGIRRISVHGLRHMYATILIEQGVSLPKISALLGHASVHTTFNFYLDVMEDIEKISSYMNNTFTNEEE